jgi:hypothetical protein
MPVNPFLDNTNTLNTQIMTQLPPYSAADIDAMKDWILDCHWADIDDEDEIHEMSDEQILRGVNRHYVGGVHQFLSDNR